MRFHARQVVEQQHGPLRRGVRIYITGLEPGGALVQHRIAGVGVALDGDFAYTAFDHLQLDRATLQRLGRQGDIGESIALAAVVAREYVGHVIELGEREGLAHVARYLRL